jgi:uncharacterized protein
MIRSKYLELVETSLHRFPVVAILGPRQCGKTTLARNYFSSVAREKEVNYFDLEDPEALARLSQPKLTLSELSGLIVIDEVQRCPDLFAILRVLVDEPQSNRKFLILGSASRDLIRQSSESLAGRIQYIELTPFSLTEVDNYRNLWLRGGFPRSYLSASDEESYDWRESYIRTFLERDIPQLGINIPAIELRRFWLMLTHNNGAILNISELGRSFGHSETLIRRYLEVLSGTFMLRLLQPWHENISKRQVKRPKCYFRDVGIFHRFLGLVSFDNLLTSPKLGASWETFALEEVIRLHRAREEEVFFWSVHSQAELDLLIVKDGKKSGFEVKYCERPQLTPSLRKAEELLALDSLTVIYPGVEDFPITDKIRAIGMKKYATKHYED